MRELIFPQIVNGNDVYMDIMNIMLGETPRTSFIDLGCHKAAHTPLFKFKERKYVDLIDNDFDFPEEKKYFEKGDILEVDTGKHYSVAFAQDVIEHLTIGNGIKLLNKMMLISGKQILFTPLDDIFGMDYETDNPESHRSLWKPEMLEGFFPDKFIFITFPNYHKIWNGGAFFFMSCEGNIDPEFDRISKEINQLSWTQ